MATLRVQIVRFVDEANPGIVECEFHDSQGQVHRIIEKIPVVTDADLWSDSAYPQPGSIECLILERLQGSNGSNLVRIAALEDTGGQSEFVVNEADVVDEP